MEKLLLNIKIADIFKVKGSQNEGTYLEMCKKYQMNMLQLKITKPMENCVNNPEIMNDPLNHLLKSIYIVMTKS